MSYQGEYQLLLECDKKEEHLQDNVFGTQLFKGNTQGGAILKARAAGWYVANRGNRCLCPEHNTRENKP